MANTIVIGSDLANPLFSFTDHEIRSIEMENGVDIVGTELTIDQLVPSVDYPESGAEAEVMAGVDFTHIVSSDGYVMCSNHAAWSDLRLVDYGTLIRYYRDGVLVSKAYVENVDRTGETTYKINAMSAIGILDTQMHRGNLYRGVKFPDVLAEIIGGSVPYTVNSELTNIKVYGWLPYDTKRANLHQLLFATGVMVARDSNGDAYFRYITSKTVKQIPDGRIYMGGSVDYSCPASAVEVTEHSFMELVTDETVTEYDNTDGSETANNTLLVFQNAPLHDLRTTGSLTIVDSGVNWAILTGTGVLTGKKYTHPTRVMTRYADNAGNQRENVKSVTDCTLVTVVNSENVAKRVLSYYSSKKTVKTAFVVDLEKPGDLVTGKDPYQKRISGFLSAMSVNVSEVNKAQATIITDYVPTGHGNNYTRAILLTGSGTVNLAELVAGKDDKNVLAILISGGEGGKIGGDGDTGTDGTADSGSSAPTPGIPGEGGEPGAPGEPGKVLTITLDASGLTSVAYSCGVGGQSDQVGGATTLGAYSSANGAVPPNGIVNLFTGAVYALPGAAGVEGAPGVAVDNEPTSLTYQGQTWISGTRGSDASQGGALGEGGYGGGPAVGADGDGGGNGAWSTGGSGGRYYIGRGGAGGDGADAMDRTETTGYGCGGNGGHGGGGAGVGGYYRSALSLPHQGYAANGKGGKGGKGSPGGDGLIIIYV